MSRVGEYVLFDFRFSSRPRSYYSSLNSYIYVLCPHPTEAYGLSPIANRAIGHLQNDVNGVQNCHLHVELPDKIQVLS